MIRGLTYDLGFCHPNGVGQKLGYRAATRRDHRLADPDARTRTKPGGAEFAPLAPAPGFEPGTARLTVGSSAVELRRITSTFTITVHVFASSQMRIAIAGRVTEIDRPLRVKFTQRGYSPRDVRSVARAASTRSRTSGSDESTPESKTTDQRKSVSPGTRRATRRAPRSPSTAT